MNYQSLFFPQHTYMVSFNQSMYHQVAQSDSVIFLKIEDHVQLQLYLFDDFKFFKKKSIKYHILLEKNAQSNFVMGIVHSLDVEIEIHFYLQGDGAQAGLSGIYALGDQQKLNIKTYQMHYGVGTSSSVALFGMLQGQAQADVQGLIFIDKLASKTDASQENKNIVLGTQAHVVSVPSIEVLNHDVQCCHGTAIGQFNEQHRWYLQSRGFDLTSAHQMLVQSFFGHVVQKFEKGPEFMEILCKKMM